MVKIEIKGLDEVIKKLESMPQSFTKEVDAVLERGAQLFVRNAKRDAPVDHGALKNGIDYEPHGGGNLSYQVSSNAHYSPYVEWGTITRVDVPAELAGYAATFKGRGLRKNGGVFPHPFFFKQQEPVRQELEKNIEAIIKDLEL